MRISSHVKVCKQLSRSIRGALWRDRRGKRASWVEHAQLSQH